MVSCEDVRHSVSKAATRIAIYAQEEGSASREDVNELIKDEVENLRAEFGLTINPWGVKQYDTLSPEEVYAATNVLLFCKEKGTACTDENMWDGVVSPYGEILARAYESLTSELKRQTDSLGVVNELGGFY